MIDAGLLDAMVEGALDGLCLLTADGIILKANHLAFEILALTKDEMIGHPAAAVLTQNWPRGARPRRGSEAKAHRHRGADLRRRQAGASYRARRSAMRPASSSTSS
jgi:PAS domain-containing protein